MKTRGVIALAVLLASLPQPGHADDCLDMTQSAMNQCAGESYERADAELNAKYREIRQRLLDNNDARGLLTAAQRNWVAYRDAECKFSSASVQGGSIYPTIYANCLEMMTAAGSPILTAIWLVRRAISTVLCPLETEACCKTTNM